MPGPSPAPGTPLAFDAALNFRELGGYPAADGRTVRRGLLWRGGQLMEMRSAADRQTLAALGLRFILDLRSADEVAAYPDWVPPGARCRAVSAMHYADGTEVDFSPAGLARERAERALVASRLGRAPSDAEMFLHLYTCMPFRNPAFRVLFAALEAGEVPLLFHCAAGKDRTGVAAMLVLLALGAGRETALRDYMHTNVCRKPAIDAFLTVHAAEYAAADAAGREQLLAIEGVSRLMAEGTLRAIERRYGSFDAYFAAEYGLTAPRLAALRERYLEHAR